MATMTTAGNFGEVLLAQGKLAEAELLLVEAVAWFRKNNRTTSYHGALVELRREQGRLDEAEQELGTLVADMQKEWGPQQQYTLGAVLRRSPRGCGTHSPTARPWAPPSCAPWWSGWASSWALRTRSRPSGSVCSRG